MFGHLFPTLSYRTFFKMGHSRPLFLYFRLFYKQLTVNKCSIKVADDWIRTWVLWYWKRPLCQLRQTTAHSYRTFVSIPLSLNVCVFQCDKTQEIKWPNFHQSCPKSSKSSFYIKIEVFEKAQKVAQYLGYFCNR